MRLKQHYSGSTANMYEVISDSGGRLMIDMGVPWTKKLLPAIDHDLSNIEGWLLSHSHLDHAKALKDVLQAGIDVYASQCTFASQDLQKHRRARWVSGNTLIRLDTFEIYCFELHHDVPILGFAIRDKHTSEFMLFATDTSHITQKFVHPFQIIAIECSYNREYLQKRIDEKTINEALGIRLLSNHMEESNCLKYIIEFCDLSKLEEVHLLHMSASNLHKDRIKKEFERKLLVEVITV